jgi:hypothetical protein
VYQNEDGTVTLRGRLERDVGALLVKALTAPREVLYQRAHTQGADTAPTDVFAETAAAADMPPMEQQQADASKGVFP